MKRILRFAAILATMAALLTGCHHGTASTHAKAYALATSTVARAQEAHAQQVVNRCLPRSHSVHSFAACAVPAGQVAKFEACLRSAASGLHHLHGLKATVEADTLACLDGAEAVK